MIDPKSYIVCFGEVLWDVYPDKKRLGGAPFNVAAHLHQLGTPAVVISKVGKDEMGQEILSRIDQQGINTGTIPVDEVHPTGIVRVNLGVDGKPSYEIPYPAAWDFIHSDEPIRGLVRGTQALVCGSLACRSATSRATLFELISLSSLTVCDLNIRLDFYNKELVKGLLEKSDILKINDEEAALLIELFGIKPANFYVELERRFSLSVIIQTLGADGAEAYADGRLYKAPGRPVEVVDTVGSGDAFLAAFLHHYLQGEGLADCLKRACQLGAFVATQPGAIPRHRNRLE